MGIPIKSLPQNVQDKIKALEFDNAMSQQIEYHRQYLTKEAETLSGIIRLEFPFKAISKDNEKIFNSKGRFFLSQKFKDFSYIVALEAKKQYTKPLLTNDLEVKLVCNFKTKVHADCGNLSKGIYDALQNIIYKNDRQIKKSTVIVNERMVNDNFHVIIEFKNKEKNK